MCCFSYQKLTSILQTLPINNTCDFLSITETVALTLTESLIQYESCFLCKVSLVTMINNVIEGKAKPPHIPKSSSIEYTLKENTRSMQKQHLLVSLLRALL